MLFIHLFSNAQLLKETLRDRIVSGRNGIASSHNRIASENIGIVLSCNGIVEACNQMLSRNNGKKAGAIAFAGATA